MKHVLKRTAVASMMLVGILTLSGTAMASPGPVLGADASSATTDSSQQLPTEVGPMDWADCRSPRICFWRDKYTGGPMHAWLVGKGCHNMNRTINNNASSFVNRTGHKLKIYDGRNCGGASKDYGSTNADGNLGSRWDNDISSFRLY